MKQAIRALGWATNIFWIILLFFTATALYSAFQLRPEFGEPYAQTSGDTLTMSLPFSIGNGGYYDISNMNLTTLVKDTNGSLISDSSTFVPLIRRGGNASVIHNMSIRISQINTEKLSYLLFNDSALNVDIALELNFANAVPFGISTNITMPWGAPLSNLTIEDISLSAFNATHFRIIAPISFENHSLFSLDGTMRLELVDNMNSVLGSGTANIPPNGGYIPLELYVSNPLDISEARLYFATSFFNYGPVVIPLA